MNILLRHTLSSITRNPVQSVIVVVSTAMITACVLLCLCVSSLFEFTTRLWADHLYGGSQMIVNTSPQHQDEVREWLEAHDDVAAYIMTYDVSATVMSEDATVRAFGSANEFGALDTYDSLISAVVLDRAENTTSLPSAHISADFAEVLGLSVGDTFTVKGNGEFFVEAVCAATSRYYSNPLLAYAYETDGLPSVTARFSVWFTDAEAALEDDNATIAAYREELCAITQDKSSVNTAIASNLAEADASVEGSMRLMNIAASVISVVMACLLLASFSVIVRGRVNELIKFKAAGATPAQSAFILIVEAALYAVVGGLIGLGIGEGLIQYLNTLLDELIVGATLAAPAYKYFTALAVGILCGIAACALPAVRMSSKPIHALIGGDERMTRKPPLLVAVFFTLTALALGVAQFFVEDMTLNVIGVLLIAVAFVWIVTSAPHFLRFAALGARGLSRHGPAYVAMCAAPRNASVNASLTMLAALIAFITLGTGIIDVVGLTAVPSSVRYDCDYIISLPTPYNGTTEESAFSMLEKVRAVEGIERANVRTYHAGYSAISTGDEDKLELDTLEPLVMVGMDEAQSLRYMCPNLDEEAIRLFAETEHPIVLTRTAAGRYGVDIGDTVYLYTGDPATPAVLSSPFTVVGIDETITSFDDFFFVTIDDMIATVGWNQGAAETLILADGDPSALAPLTELMDSDPVKVYTRDGFFSAEGKDKLDTSRLIGMFTFIIYGIAGLGLVNLIVLTAGSRMKEFDVLRLAGLTPHGACDYIFTETGMLSAIGFALGLLSAFFVNRASAAIVQLIGKYITTEAFPVRMIVIAAALTGIFALLWALSHVIAFVRTTSRRYRSRDDRLLRSD